MVDFIKGDWVYDLETFPNCFTCCAVYANGNGLRVFEISDRKNEIEEMLEFLRSVKKHSHRMVAFNNVNFDYQILHYILEKSKRAIKYNEPLSISANELYTIASELIKSRDDDKFGRLVHEKDFILPQVDLYKIHHFDNKAKATSLKMLEFNMRSDNIEDLPFEVGKGLTDSEIDVLIEYNKHDVMQTLKFYYQSLDAIRFRADLTQKYGFDCTNFNDTKIGKQLFINRLEEASPGCCYRQVGRRRVMQQTKREYVNLEEVIFPYVKFERPEFNSVLKWFKKQKIVETKGVFTDILESDLGNVAKYADMKTKRKKLKQLPTDEELEVIKKEKPSFWISTEPLKSGKESIWLNWKVAETLNVVIDGLRIDYGTGGIHAARENSVYKNVYSVDVASMYPNLAIANNVFPQHLGSNFCEIYKGLYEERKRYGKGTPENAVLKLALNGTYGETNNQYSPLFDPQYTMAITVNGQLSICMLTEMLLKIPTVKVLMLNTDGLEYIVDDEYLEDTRKTCSEWESITKLTLEGATYSKLFIADVNSYIAVYGE